MVENSILGRSLSGEAILDDYRLKSAPDTAGGVIALRVRENEQEHTALEEVRLVAVDHSPEVSAFAVGDRVVLGSRRAAAQVVTAAGADITTQVDGTGEGFIGEPGETLTVSLGGVQVAGRHHAAATLGGSGMFETDAEYKDPHGGEDKKKSTKLSPRPAGGEEVGVRGSMGTRRS